MAQRNTRVRVRPSDVPVGTGVYAPSSVGVDETASRNAAALSRALGIGAKAYDDHVGRRQQADYEAGTLAAESGDATLETIADARQQQSAAWVLGAERVLARTRAIEDEAALLEWYESSFDKNLPITELRHQLNQQMASRYSGADAGIAREAAPFLKRAADAIMGAHGERQSAEARQTVATGLSKNVSEWLSRDSRTVDEWDDFRSQYTGLLGKEEGLQALAADLGLYAVNSKDEAILDDPMFSFLRTNPKTRTALDSAYEDAKQLRVEARVAAETNQRALTYTGLMQLAEAKDESIFQLVKSATTPDADGQLAITQAQAQAIYNEYFRVASGEHLTPAMVQLWADGNFGRLGDEKWEDQSAQKAIADFGAIYGPEAARSFAVERSVMNDGMPPFLEQLISRTNPNHPQWQEAVDWYATFKAQQPSFTESQLTDDVKRRFESYMILAEDLGHEGALERLNNYDKSLVDNITRDEREDALKSVRDTITDIPWSWRTVEETPALRQMLERNFDHMIGLGYNVDRAAEFAIERTQRGTALVDGRLFPANAGFGPDPQGVVDMVKAEYADKMGYDVDDVEVIPVPRQPTSVYVRSRGGLDFEKVTLAGANERYAQVRREVELAARTKATEQRDARILELVKQSMFPRMHEDPFMHANREAMWNRLSPAEQRAAVDRYAESEAAAVRDRKERDEARGRYLRYLDQHQY